MKILFVFRSTSFIIYFKSIIEELCGRGHEVRVFFDKKWSKKNRFSSHEILEEMKKANPRFGYELIESRRGFLRHILFPLRELRSYRRYLMIKNQSDFYRRDWINFLPRKIRPFLIERDSIANKIVKSNLAGVVLRLAENLSPADSRIRSRLREHQPDVVVVSPANMRHSSADAEYLKTAKAIGVPAAVSVFSWDNLTVRGVIPVVPDLLFVWNKTQMKEAISEHGIPADRVKITGAPLFDGWFVDFKPSMPREDFCRAHNLRPDFPYILYLGSSRNIAKDEVWLIKELKKALDNSGDERKNIQLAIRPHPANYEIYEHLTGDGIVIVPKRGTLPSTADARQLFYDTLYYSIGTVGINTSGMIDAIIVDKPGIAVMTDVYRQTQLEAAHFRYFLEADCLEIAKSSEEFSQIAKRLLAGHDVKNAQRKKFVTTFIRPVGLDTSAGKRAADEIELLTNRKL